ncbi:hypothetical protein BGX27_010278 [Mortierella sp. AM989]|nr:hypothetical protein BGX27_010278 [Mortierella sp. AM989]
MSSYERIPTIDEDTVQFSSSLSPPFRRANRILPDLTNAIRARASSFVSDLSGPSFPDNNSNTTSVRNATSNFDTDTSSTHLPSHYPSSVSPIPSSSPTIPLFHDMHPLLGNSSSQSSESNSKNSRRQRAINHRSTHVRLLRIIWFVALLVGEHGVYWALISRCAWPENSLWDKSNDALKQRYRVAIVADPQLTDWMSYRQTGLLLALVETYTDIYMKRSFHRMHAALRPDAVIFLGDLNDGGRNSYGEIFEKNKNRFFEKIFESKSSAWNEKPIVMDESDGTTPPYPQEDPSQDGTIPDYTNVTGHYRQLVDIPTDAAEREAIRNSGKSVRLYVAGNHDVGFGNTLIKSAMTRYKQVFGSVNYKVAVGNHSIVVLDTLSLSSNVASIREESEHFLEEITNEPPSLPRILFTHVPLYRLDTTYCGDTRSSKQLIINRGGVQYYNMVSANITRQILSGMQPDMVFSGDDHDWCEIAHSLDGTLIPEVTVRTFSFAQGNLQPGFVMLSLYNPDHKTKNEFTMIPLSSGLPISTGEGLSSVARPSDNATFVYEECMQPNQLLIYMCYGALFGISLNWILIQRFRWIMLGRRHLPERSLLARWRTSASINSNSNALPQGSTTATAISSQPQESLSDIFVSQDAESQSDEQYPNSFNVI